MRFRMYKVSVHSYTFATFIHFSRGKNGTLLAPFPQKHPCKHLRKLQNPSHTLKHTHDFCGALSRMTVFTCQRLPAHVDVIVASSGGVGCKRTESVD